MVQAKKITDGASKKKNNVLWSLQHILKKMRDNNSIKAIRGDMKANYCKILARHVKWYTT